MILLEHYWHTKIFNKLVVGKLKIVLNCVSACHGVRLNAETKTAFYCFSMLYI